jgi:hypothetical protein
MSDPERLLKSGAVDPDVRDLLKSLREIAPAPRAGVNSWGAMAARVATLPTVVPAPGTAAPSAAGTVGTGVSHALGVKLVAAVVASTVLGAGGYWYHVEHRAPNRVASVAPSAVVAPLVAAPVAAVTPPADGTPTDSAAADIAPVQSNTPPSPAASGTRRSRLDAEASLLAKVRSQLRSGDSHGALATLNQLQAQFPRGELSQERDVLTVEVLAANGNTAAAKRKANAFIAAHPSSPHSAKLERFVEAQ